MSIYPECIHGNPILGKIVFCKDCMAEFVPAGINMTATEVVERFRETVDHPSHYTQGGIECIDALQAALTPEEFIGFCKGNIFKYLWREKVKGGAESLKKAKWYIERLLTTEE